MSKVIHIDSESQFNTLYAKPKVVIDFTASWCGPCKMIAPKYEAFAGQFPDITFLKVDVDEQAKIAEKYGVEAMPTFIFLNNGEQVDKLTGASVDQLEIKLKALNTK